MCQQNSENKPFAASLADTLEFLMLDYKLTRNIHMVIHQTVTVLSVDIN